MATIVTIDEHSGFCFGVVRAIREAEKQMTGAGTKTGAETDSDTGADTPKSEENQPEFETEKSCTETDRTGREILYCLGEIVHNNEEVCRLEKMGLRVIGMDEFRRLRNVKVLIRAHGEPPETYRIARENRIQLIDATCPIVLKLQQRIKEGFERMQRENGQVLIYGKAGHAEVIGLNGQTGNRAHVISSLEDLDRIDFSIPTLLYAQTTMNTEKYEEISRHIARECSLRNTAFEAVDSICKSMSHRAARLKEFALGHDAVVFVSGRQSSNGKYLYTICKTFNPKTFFVSSPDELNKNDFISPQGDSLYTRIGICGATSTPMWLMESVARRINNFSECI